jgi:prepilin signal peptidase PulO-like enzyme (type II secretory pathway)
VQLPLPITLTLLFAAGLCAGSLVNWAAYRLAWHPRRISPWCRAESAAPRRRWTDLLPVVGWLGLRRERALHGRAFWLRPMAVELATGAGVAALYWWEVVEHGLLPPLPLRMTAAVEYALHVQFAVHVALCLFMLAASLIDIDEKIIPDAVTVPGTLLGLTAAALYPAVLLPTVVQRHGSELVVLWLKITSPYFPPEWLEGAPHRGSLALACGCWWLWCVALMPRTWYPRHGWRRALGLAWTRMLRERASRYWGLLGLLGCAPIAYAWYRGGDGWLALLTALVAMIGGGGLVWMVRVVGWAVLRREAMGFGDVILTAMIGTYLGWQGCLILFFLAPFAALVLGAVVLLLRRGQEIPYGPFLCLAALVVLVRWADLWKWAYPIFSLGLWLPVILVICMAVLALLLGILQVVKALFRRT